MGLELYISKAEFETLLTQPIGMSWGQKLTLKPEEEHFFAKTETEVIDQINLLLELLRAQNQFTRLEYLAAAFGLDQFELDTLLLCLASALDLRYERLFGYLQDDVTRKRPAVNLILDLLSGSGPDRPLLLAYFTDEASLFKYQLLERGAEPGPVEAPWISQVLAPDKTVVAWLLGGY